MTCIVGLRNDKGVILAGDSAGVEGFNVTIRKDSKVFKVNNILIGYTSSFRMGQIIRYHLDITYSGDEDEYDWMVTVFIPHIRKILQEHGFTKINNNEESGGVFLVGINNRLFIVESDFQVGESNLVYESVGCGEKYAKGYIYAALGNINNTRTEEQIVEGALYCATNFSAGVRPPFNFIKNY